MRPEPEVRFTPHAEPAFPAGRVPRPAASWEGEAPAEPLFLREGEAPAEPLFLREGEAPAEPLFPREGEAPAEPRTPAEPSHPPSTHTGTPRNPLLTILPEFPNAFPRYY